MTKQRRKCCWNLPNVFCVFKSRKVPHTYFILIYIYTKPCNFLATGAGKWSVPQLEVIFNSRIPYSVGNKIQNHLFKTEFCIPIQSFYSCPRGTQSCGMSSQSISLLTDSQACWVCCTSLLSCSSRSSIAPQPSRRRLQLQRATRLTSKEQAKKLERVFPSDSWQGNDRASSTPTGKLGRGGDNSRAWKEITSH